jgi:hypothetical protein
MEIVSCPEAVERVKVVHHDGAFREEKVARNGWGWFEHASVKSASGSSTRTTA